MNERIVTDAQLHLLHHTLGISPERREPYRNHFVAGPGHYAQPDLEMLELAGFMQRGRTPAFCNHSDVVFQVTELGREYAIDHLPPAPKRTRFQEFLAFDGGYDTFADFLGIRLPEVEWNGKWGNASLYRYVRRDWTYRIDVVGEWKPTKKEAKATYKTALTATRRQQHARPGSLPLGNLGLRSSGYTAYVSS